MLQLLSLVKSYALTYCYRSLVYCDLFATELYELYVILVELYLGLILIPNDFRVLEGVASMSR